MLNIIKDSTKDLVNSINLRNIQMDVCQGINLKRIHFPRLDQLSKSILLIENKMKNNQVIIGLTKKAIETALYNHNIIEAKLRFFNSIIKLEQNKINQFHIITK